MIEGICETNLDGYDSEKWPTIFANVPSVGDRVASVTGKTLKVSSVTHTQKVEVEYEEEREVKYPYKSVKPYIVVELNK